MRVLIILMLCALAMPASAEVLSGKVVWSGEKQISDKVRVDPGAHLVIKPGSSILFTGGSLEVAGRLTARNVIFKGESWNGIVLKGCGLDTLITESEVSGARIGIQVIGGAPRLEELLLANNDVGVEIRQQSEATIAGSTFRANRKVGLFVKDGATAVVLNNRFEKNGKYGAYVFRSTPRRFSGNVFSSHETGLMIAFSGSNPEILDNCFDHNQVAIRVEKAARPRISGSDISRNKIGISLYRRADPEINGNLIAENETGIEIAFSSYPKISNNDFINNGKAIFLEFQSSEWEQDKGAAARQAESSSRSSFGSLDKASVELSPPRNFDGTIDARDNWWGEAATRELEKAGRAGNPVFIDDGQDRPTFIEEGKTYPLDRVVFDPWRRKSFFSSKAQP